MSLRAALGTRPVIYEIVPPRKDTSRFNTELKGVEEVLDDRRIVAINIPELINRVERKDEGVLCYSPTTIPPEEYAMMVKERKEPIVNIVVPRMKREDFLRRARKVVHDYEIPNLILVGKERHGDRLPGPGVLEAFEMLKGEKRNHLTLGGICIFDRETLAGADYGMREGGTLSESRRVLLKARSGCDFITSQITFDSEPALRFLSTYQRLCHKTGMKPLTVFISLATVPSTRILSLLESLDVVFPRAVQKRLRGSSDMGSESLRIETEVFEEVVEGVKREGIRVPLALQIDQVGVSNGELSLDLLDSIYPILITA